MMNTSSELLAEKISAVPGTQDQSHDVEAQRRTVNSESSARLGWAEKGNAKREREIENEK